MSEEKKGFFRRLKEGLTKTRNNIVHGIDSVFNGFSNIDDDFYEELEEILIMGDIGVQATEAILERLREQVKENHIKEPADCKSFLIQNIKEQMQVQETAYVFEERQSVVLVIGVNGVGKTTTVGKLAGKLKGQGRRVLIAAAACALLIGSAFAASPTLRELIGSFAPYAQEQEDRAYTMDGFQVKVLSALTDGSTIRAYVQVKDLEGDRLSADMEPWGTVDVLTDNEQGLNIDGTYWSYSFDPGYAVYNGESKTALLVFTSWGQNFGDLENAKLEIRHIHDYVSKIEYEPIPEDELGEEGITA